MHILHIPLYTLLRFAIISFILLILMNDSVVLLWGEIRCWSLLGFKEKIYLPDVSDIRVMFTWHKHHDEPVHHLQPIHGHNTQVQQDAEENRDGNNVQPGSKQNGQTCNNGKRIVKRNSIHCLSYPMQFPWHEANISIASSPWVKCSSMVIPPPDLIRFSRGKLTLPSEFCINP